MSFAFALRQPLRGRHVEACVHERLEKVDGKRRMNRIVARAFILEEALAVLHVPLWEALAIFVVLLVRVADRVAVVDRESRAAVLLVALVLVVAQHDQRVDLGAGERLRQALDRAARDVLAGDEMFRRHHVRHLRIGLFEQIRHR